MFPKTLRWKRSFLQRETFAAAVFLAGSTLLVQTIASQAPPPRAAASKASPAPAKPKLVVLLVVDQMRADYVVKFLPQWTGGLKRLAEERAWFRDPASPYPTTETWAVASPTSTR